MKKNRLTTYSILCFGLTLSFLGCQPDDAPITQFDKPNIVILYADDLGYGDLSIYGHPTIRTPNADSLSRQGMRLMSFYNAAAACTPSRGALLTGRYPVRAGIDYMTFPETIGGLPLEEITLAEILKEEGYRTAAFGKWHLGHNPVEYLPTSRGFDEFFGLPYSNDMIPPWVDTDIPLRYYENGERLDDREVDQTRMDVNYTERAVDFIKRAAGDPFFLYLPYSMPHVPVYAPDDKINESINGVYGDAVETIDWSIGKVVDALEQAGVADNTIVIFTSDNGPWMEMPERMFSDDVHGMHKPIRPWDAGTSGLLKGSKATAYEGGFRVPGIIRWPGHIPSNSVSSETVTTMDLFTTLIEAAGGSIPQDRIIDGNNVMNVFTENGTSPTEIFYYFPISELKAVRNGDWKLVMHDESSPELYHLGVDPGERYNRADERPDLVEKMTDMMIKFEEEVREW